MACSCLIAFLPVQQLFPRPPLTADTGVAHSTQLTSLFTGHQSPYSQAVAICRNWSAVVASVFVQVGVVRVGPHVMVLAWPEGPVHLPSFQLRQ